MSLRFLRRRDRDRSDSSNDTSPSLAFVALPPSDSFLRKVKTATVPSEVQIISWHPKDLEAAGRDVCISSRADSTASTPVYHAFTSAHPSAGVAVDQGESRGRSGSDVGNTVLGGRDMQAYRGYEARDAQRARPKTAPRIQTRQPVFNPRSAADWDTPRSEHVEELSGSLGGGLRLEQQQNREQEKRSSSIVRLTAKARRVKARSQHAHIPGEAHADDNVPSFDATSSSLPASSGGFSTLHCNTSVSSLAHAAPPKAPPNDLHLGELASSPPGATTSLLSRIAPTRPLRRTKNTSSADMQFLPTTAVESQSGVSADRSRTESLGLLTSKLLWSKDGAQPAAAPGKAGKIRSTAPPSAWRTESIAVGTGEPSSSAYSSDNEPSTAASSSERSQRHARHASLGQVVLGVQQLSFSAAADGSPTRFSASSSASPPAAAAPQPPFVSGLPNLPPSPPPIVLLLQRIGPPPLGASPLHLDHRITLIKQYILNQLPLPSPPGIAPPHTARQTTLADEFDKLECVAERELGAAARGLRLDEAFGEARRACGLAGKVRFEVRSEEVKANGLAPAPRRRRRPGTAPSHVDPARDSFTKRPPSSNDTHSSTSHGSASGVGRSPLLFGHVLEGRRAEADRRSEDTVLSDGDAGQWHAAKEVRW